MKGSKSISSQLIRNYTFGSNRKIRNQLGLRALPIPYMKLKEMDLIEEILIGVRPMKVLEYGCGYSTIYFPKYLPEGGVWHSIEHHKQWFEMIAGEIGDKSKFVHLHLVNADDQNEKIPENKRFTNFVNYPDKIGKFDLILVDGMARNSCISKSKHLLNRNGLLIVHDANREEYHEEIKKFSHWMILTDFRKTSGGIAFASMDKPVFAYFDLNYHKKLWSIDNQINNFFKFKFLVGQKGKPLKIYSSESKK